MGRPNRRPCWLRRKIRGCTGGHGALRKGRAPGPPVQPPILRRSQRRRRWECPMKKGQSPFGAPAFPTSHASSKPLRTSDHRCGQPVGAPGVRQVISNVPICISPVPMPKGAAYCQRPRARAYAGRAAPPRRGRPPFRGKAQSASGGLLNTPRKCAAVPYCRWSWSKPPWPGCGPFGGAGRGPPPSRTCRRAARHCAAQSRQARGPSG